MSRRRRSKVSLIYLLQRPRVSPNSVRGALVKLSTKTNRFPHTFTKARALECNYSVNVTRPCFPAKRGEFVAHADSYARGRPGLKHHVRRYILVPLPPHVYPTSTSRDVSDQAYHAHNCPHAHNSPAYIERLAGKRLTDSVYYTSPSACAHERGHVVCNVAARLVVAFHTGQLQVSVILHPLEKP